MKTDRKFSFSLLILGVLFSCAQAPQEIQEKLVPTAPEDVRNSIVRIVSPPENRGMGNGFFVTPDKIATNIHLIAGADPISAHIRGYGGTRSIRGVIAYDVKNNLVILKVSVEGVPLPLGDSNAVKVDDPISAIDPFATKYENKDPQRTILGVRDGDMWFLTTLDPDPDTTGGPVLNSRGKVVGIEVMEGDFGYAIPSNTLKMLLDGSDTVEPLAEWQQREMIRAYSSVEQAKRKFRDGDHTGMIETLNEAITLNQEFAIAYTNRGEGKLRLGEFESAQGNETKAQLHYRSAIDDFDKTLQLNPESAATYKNRALTNSCLQTLKSTVVMQQQHKSTITWQLLIIRRSSNECRTIPQAIRIGGPQGKILVNLESNQGNAVAAQHHYNAAITDYTQASNSILIMPKPIMAVDSQKKCLDNRTQRKRIWRGLKS